MEAQRETRRRSLRGAGPVGPTPVRRRSLRHHHVEVPEKPANVVFNPSDPYSAAMDDMPLKDLFPNMKVRKRSQGKKVEAVEVPSPKNTESDESVRSKLRDSLAAALAKTDSAEWEQDRGQAENEKGEQVENTDCKPEKGDKKMANDEAMTDLEGVSLEQKAWADLKDNVKKLDSTLDDCKLVKEENVDSADIVEAPSKRIKLEVENIKAADSSNQNEASELAERMAFDIEAELYKQFGGVNRKYKEKARSLLFNLKDRSNPELRSRVLAGEITPENLCSMNAEQLASKELSEWRMAKAEEFAHMVVLTEADAEQPRLVKKTHKGEIEVEVEKDDLLTEVVTAGSQPRFALATQQEIEETSANALPSAAIPDEEIDNCNDTEVVEPDREGLEFSPIRELNLTVGISAATDQVPDVMMLEVGDELDGASQEEENAGLPAILSLDEFVGSKKVKEPKVPVKGDELDLKLGLNEVKPLANLSQIDSGISPSLTNVKDKVPRKSVTSPNRKHVDFGNSKNGAISQKERKKEHRSNEKLWEGSFQLSGSQISPVLALFKSGDGVELQSWPKLIEIKGRVRLDALEKFLQELRLSRTRAVMIITCRVGEGDAERGASVNAMKEAANQYQRGERVGYAEPVPGYELYLFPGAGSSLKLLVEHGYLNSDQISAEEDGILIGFVVCRRNTAPSNVSHKSSSHYFNANRHALSAQLDSPTRPNEIQWTGNVVATSKTSSKELDNYSTSLSFINLQGGGSVANNSSEGHPASATKSKSSSLLQIGQNPVEPDSLFPQAPQDLRSGKVKPEWLRKELVKDEDADDDLPPGFGPKAMTMPKRSILDDDDDDLPEYDFSSQNSAPIFTSIKAPDVGPPASFNMQAYPHGLMFPPLPQAPQGSVGGFSSQLETAIPFEQLNPTGQHPSQFPRPIASHVGGPLEQVRSLAPSSAQVSQPLHFQAAGPRPPPGPPPGPPPYGIFPPRPHMTADGSFAMRMPSAAMPTLNVLHAEQKEAFAGSFNQLPQNRPSTPQAYDEQRTRATIPSVQGLPPVPVSQTPSGPGQRRGGNQGSSLWDDDDMPEWCPPAVAQPSENRQIPPHPPVLQNVESGSASVPPRGMAPPLVGGGWQGMPLPAAVPLQGEGRGILQAPPPAMRYPGPPSGGHFPISRPEKFPNDRGSSIRPNETRSFKGGK